MPSSVLGKCIHQPRKTKSLFNWLARVTGTDAVWIEGIDEQDQPIWALAKRLSRTCWYLVSKKLKATAGIAALGGALLLPAGSLHAQTGEDGVVVTNLKGANGFIFYGVDNTDLLGRTVAVGDFNHDGFDDMMTSAPWADPNGINKAGEIYVIFGTSTPSFASPMKLDTLGSRGFVINGQESGGEIGIHGLASGDINGDGIDDMIIGNHQRDGNGYVNAGETHVVFGRSTGFPSVLELTSSLIDGSSGFVVNGVDNSDNSGWGLASGDINGDSIDDLIIGAPNRIDWSADRYGEVYVVFGFDNTVTAIDTVNLDTLSGDGGFALAAPAGLYSAFAGRAVASGDINGDTYDDVIIGAPEAGNGDEKGRAFVVFGKSTAFNSWIDLSSLDGNTGFAIDGPNERDYLGSAVGSGDINGDGIDDLIIGAPGGSLSAPVRPPGSSNHVIDGQNKGKTYVVFGTSTGFAGSSLINPSSLNGSDGFVLNGVQYRDNSGYSVATGDINGDSIDDLVIGARRADCSCVDNDVATSSQDSNHGEAHVVFGKTTGFASSIELASLDGTTGYVLHGVNRRSQLGRSVATGDFNGDGRDDVFMGGEEAATNGISAAGEAYIFTQFPAAAELTGGEGLRMLAAPASGSILDDFLARFWTQGMTGSDSPNGDPNVWVWNETAGSTGEWTAVSDLSGQHMARGEGFLMHVFSDDDFDGTPDGFPKMLNTINIFDGAVVDTGTVTPVTGLGDGRFFLVGNPYPTTIDWDLASVTKSNLSNSIYIYDDATDVWQNWNGSIGNITNGEIAPFQSFFIQGLDNSGGSNSNNGSLSIGDGAQTGSPGTLFKTLPSQEPKALKIQAEAGDKKTDAWLSFQEGGELQRDIYDGLYLQPLTAEFLKLGTILDSEEVLQINALPVDQQEELVIPLDLSATIEATHARLSFTGLEAFEGWEFSLRDTHTGEEFPISSTSLELEIESIQAKLRTSLLPAPMPMQAKTTGSRYYIVVTPGAPVYNEPDPGIPSAIELQQNYPNPFNPATTIEFGVPVQGTVRLEVFDMLGRKVAELLNGPMQPGRYSVRFDASALSSGVYIYRLQTGSKSLIQKMTLIK